MQNESDALHILALASGEQNNQRKAYDHGTVNHLADFALVKLGILTTGQVKELSEMFFKFHHHLFVSPIPTALTPAYDPLVRNSQK
jgi:hypothetical protein